MSDRTLTPPDAATAERLMRHFEPEEALEAGILTPMAGTRPVRLFSLKEASRFLVVHDKASIDAGGMWATVNYVDPASLVRWIAVTVGDKELASEVDNVAASRRAYGFLVPKIKALLEQRVEQCESALGLVAEPRK